VRVRIHWHLEDIHLLHGDQRASYWYGSGCPPECDRPVGPPAWSTGAIKDREWADPDESQIEQYCPVCEQDKNPAEFEDRPDVTAAYPCRDCARRKRTSRRRTTGALMTLAALPEPRAVRASG
jgi:hypothetical protein